MKDATPSLWHPIEWGDDGRCPTSQLYGDIFFHEADGLSEVQHVFLEGNKLSQRFSESTSLTIGELGFGTGLNMLAAWQLFEELAPPGARLHLVSIDKHPLAVSDIRRALSTWPEFTEHSQKLCALYPPIPTGVQTIDLDPGRVTLTLLFGDATEMLSNWNGKVDAWFLDGFAPDKNEAMWNAELYTAIASHSREGTTLSTYTAAGHVRRGLEAAGFSMTKEPGHGTKRHMLAGHLPEAPVTTPSITPWFSWPDAPPAPKRRAAVVGAGIAGAAMARELAQSGWQVHLIDANDGPAQGGSGNRLGMAMPRLTRQPTPLSTLSMLGIQTLHRVLTSLDESGHSVPSPGKGIIDLAWNPEETQRLRDGLDAFQLPNDVAHWVDAEEASALAGVSLPVGGVYFPIARCVRPGAFCQQALTQAAPALTTHYGVQITELSRTTEGWTLESANANLPEVDVVILCNAQGVDHFSQTACLPKKVIRGQSAWVPAQTCTQALDVGLVYQGYLLPAVEGQHVIGATYGVHDDATDLREEDHTQLVTDFENTFPHWGPQAASQWSTLNGWASVRMMAPDNLPMIGPVPVSSDFKNHYNDLHLGRHYKSYPDASCHPGLYVSVAHGSRGMLTGVLGARLLSAHLNKEPDTLETSLIHTLNPARFLIRDLKRQKN